MPAVDGERGTQAINRALGLLRLFRVNEPHLSLREIGDRSGLTVPTAHRMARALQANGFLVQDPLTGRYALGPAVMELAFVVLRNSDTSSLVRIATPYLDSLRAMTGETVGLHVPASNGRLCVAESESRHMMRMATGVGNVLPWHAGAASKAMLAFMPPAEQMHVLASAPAAALTANTILDSDQLRRSLAEIKKKGYAISEGETVLGAAAIAMPILDASGSVAGSVNITGPVTRWTRHDMVAVLPQLTDAVKAIESLLSR
jgi:DNA-binding IclR family transcriptional regulator